MRHLGGCTECFTVWHACRCPLRCAECGAGYRDDGNSNCGTPGCEAGQRRRWAMQARDEDLCEPPPAAPTIQREAIEGPASPAEPAPIVEPLAPDEPEPEAPPGSAEPPQSRRPTPARPPAPRSAARPAPRPDKLVARPVAQRRADVVALLGEGLSDREIARRVKVSPSTVSTVRRQQAQEAAKFAP